MGKASKKKREKRERGRGTASAAPTGATGSGDPRALGEQALDRLVRSNTPGRLSLAGAYAWGYAALGHAQLEGTEPDWYQEFDPLDALFLGTVWPDRFRDELEFANARDAWLRLLKGTAHGKGIQRFVREAVTASEDLNLPVNDGNLMLALNGRLEAAGLDQRRLPERLLPKAALHDSRVAQGPPLDLPFPDPSEDSEEQTSDFWDDSPARSWAEDTPAAVLRDGLHRLQAAGLPVEKESGLLLLALYAALMPKPGELLEDMFEHAQAWAFSLDDASPLVPVLDILLTAPELEMSVAETLGHLFALPAFSERIPSEALLWTSSPGLALLRLAFELGVSRVSTRTGTVTPDLLDWVGMHTRMSLSSVARGSATDLGTMDSVDDSAVTQEESDERWAERREAVREAVLRKVRKKPSRQRPTHQRQDPPIERIWNADGSSLIRISTESPRGGALTNALERQIDSFREKFGREPEPDDPIFFDPDTDEPTRLTKEHIDSMLLEMAEHAAEFDIDPAYFHACREVGYMVTEESRTMFTTAEVIAFNTAVARHRQAEA